MKLIKFGAEWCHPCKLVNVVVDQFKSLGECEVETVDIDEQPELAEKFKVQSIPHFVWEHQGKVLRQHSGVCTLNQLRTTLRLVQSDAKEMEKVVKIGGF